MSNRATLANAIRALTMDAIQIPNSGHPGAPMGMADIAEVLYNDFMKHNPTNPNWADRDRFIMSNGHGSMLPYSVLHLTGYDLSIDDLKSFRKLHSKTPGHPEYGYAPGIETTTGPLGQGITNAVGFALAEKVMAAQFNKDGHEIVDHNTYVFLGDGCLMEGISHEACSLAGSFGLGKMICFYDDNDISIDGNVDGWFIDDTPKRFEAYGWHVQSIDGHDPEAIKAATQAAIDASDRPSLICCKTVIGKGAPNKEGGHHVHGEALGAEEIAATRKNLGWDYPPFEIPAEVYAGWDAKEAGTVAENEWNAKFAAYSEAYPEEASEFERRMAGELPIGWDEFAAKAIADINEAAPTQATRISSKMSLNAFSPMLPELLGGSADLTPSNNTFSETSVKINDNNGSKEMNFAGNYISYGVREFGMSAIMNGVTLHGGLVPYGATFLMFSEYARNALRMAALMKIQSIFVYTHDSIGLGEDGPTHQAVEQIPTLRMIPNMSVWRTCDAVETAVSWKHAIERNNGPTTLIYSRQNLAHQPRSAEQIANIEKGGYILVDTDGTPDAIVIATGSEVDLAVKAAEASDKKVRVVSMPSVDMYEAQDDAYKESVLPAAVTARVAVEAAIMDGWWKYVGTNGKVIGMTTFGESAPAPDLFEYFGFTVDNVVNAINEVA
ncbi:transketolase [Cocleimonas sp. KMM 6892]|jgi:transketolase|uniref:transketolase n=1 Tax=unclassified Cocleimonas TaxID=2639732 RepID=UPI002DB85C4B|nr:MULTISPECIES: transketolase [unclassified Cocleimonas]MEB8431334.1 transketolase [Cocleimonas sp. KMM 6892]MEC4713894.1 transketolase [Cocleimonas sp. KMM 6895]MEC4743225.1 transketolase [Cocleimonas sp. KMM 6896]